MYTYCINAHRTHASSLTLTHNREALYPFLSQHNLNEIVEDNVSCHNNDVIREEHRSRNVQLVGYHATATEQEKEDIRALIREQVQMYNPPRTIESPPPPHRPILRSCHPILRSCMPSHSAPMHVVPFCVHAVPFCAHACRPILSSCMLSHSAFMPSHSAPMHVVPFCVHVVPF